MERNSPDIEPGQRHRRYDLILGLLLFGLEPGRCRISRFDKIDCVVRRDTMGLGLWCVGSAWDRRNAVAANTCADLHGNLAAASLASVFCAIAWQATEIRHVRMARCQVSIVVPTLRLGNTVRSEELRTLTNISPS